MDEEKREGTFIPCGDSMEKMEELCDDTLENVVGGMTIRTITVNGQRVKVPKGLGSMFQPPDRSKYN